MRTTMMMLLAAPLALVAAAPVSALCVAAKDMNGVWQATDGGTYRIRQVGNEVWWLGTSKDGGKSFTNVFHGTRTGNILTGTWADVPAKGQPVNAGSHGSLKLQVFGGPTSVTGMKQIASTGGFAAKNWFKPCDDTVQNPVG